MGKHKTRLPSSEYGGVLPNGGWLEECLRQHGTGYVLHSTWDPPRSLTSLKARWHKPSFYFAQAVQNHGMSLKPAAQSGDSPILEEAQGWLFSFLLLMCNVAVNIRLELLTPMSCLYNRNQSPLIQEDGVLCKLRPKIIFIINNNVMDLMAHTKTGGHHILIPLWEHCTPQLGLTSMKILCSPNPKSQFWFF